MITPAVKKKKILYVITKSNFGGAQRYVYDLATELNKEGYDVAVALGGAGTLKKKLEEKGVRTITVPSFQRDINPVKEIRSFFELLAVYKTEAPSVIHLNSSKAGGLGSFAARMYNLGKDASGQARIIFTAHGWAFTEDRSFLSKKILSLLQWLTIKFSDATIAVSRETKHEILDAYPKVSQKIHVIHNGVAPTEVLYPRDARKALLEFTSFGGAIDVWSTQTLWIGTIGELNKNKGIETIIESMSFLSDYFHSHNVSLTYFVIGDGEDEEKLKELAKKRGLASAIFFLGYVEEAAKYLRAFDIFLLPSYKEGLPYVILEAGAAGVPVVASDTGGIPDVVHDMTSGLLCHPEDKEAFAEAIVTYAKSPELRQKHGLHLKENVVHNFTLEHMVNKTSDLYFRN